MSDLKKQYIFLEENEVMRTGDEKYSNMSGWIPAADGFLVHATDVIRREIKVTVVTTEPEVEYTIQLTEHQIEVLDAVVDCAAVNAISSNEAHFLQNILLRIEDKEEVEL